MKRKEQPERVRHSGVVQNQRVTIFLLLLFLLGAFLRFFRLEENFYFSGEIGHNLLAIKDAFFYSTIPLIGPPTSHSWLFFGPLFYWIYGPILILANFNPLSHAYFGAVVSWIVLPLNFFVIKRLFSSRVALLSTFLIAISPLFMEFAHFSRFFSIVPVLIYPFLYFLYRIIQGERKYLFWLAFTYGCMFSFHFTPFMLFPFVISLFIMKRVKLSGKQLLIAIAGFALPMLPFFLYDIQHGLQMTSKVVLWVPYRVAGFFGLIPKNTVSTEVLHENTSSLFSFIGKSFLPHDLASIAAILLLVSLLYALWKHEDFSRKKLPISTAFLLVLLWFGWGCVAVFVHGSPPLHYFLPILPLPILFFSLFLDRVMNKSSGRYFAIGVLVIMFFLTMGYYFSNKWFYVSQSYGDWSIQDVPFVIQKRVAQTIIDDAKGQKFALMRVGVNDQFEGDYAQNYTYLLWLMGNEPVQQAENTYIIVEQPERIGKKYAGAIQFLRVGNILIIKISTKLLPQEESLTYNSTL